MSPHGATPTTDSGVHKLTPKGRATRQRIVEGAAAEIRVSGAVATTVLMSTGDLSYLEAALDVGIAALRAQVDDRAASSRAT